VVRCLPVAVFVGVTETRHTQRRRISERPAEVSRSRACADRRLERVNDPERIVNEQRLSEDRVVGPATHTAAGSKQLRQFAGSLVGQRNEVNGLAPGGRLFGTTGGHHLTDDRRQYSRRVLPADQVEALECFIDEIERMPTIGKRPLSFSREQSIGKHGRRETSRNRREQGALGSLAMAYACPAPQPALERGRLGLAF